MGYDTQTGRFAHGWGKGLSHLYVWTWYAIALGVGCGTAWAVQEAAGEGGLTNEAPLLLAAVADVAATIVIWVSGILVNNSSMYDAYWSLFTPVVLVYWVVEALDKRDKDVPAVRVVLLFISVWVWAVRLTSNWARDWPGLHHEDFRYVRIRGTFQSAGLPKAAYWVGGSLMGIMVFPTFQVFVGSLPVYFAASTGENKDGGNGLNALDFIASAVCVGAAVVQFVADEQMRRFRSTPHEPGTVMEAGLWRYSRHPNYFGELSFWFGLYLHALAVDAGRLWWTGAGFVALTLMFVLASIPLMEKRMLDSRPAFAETIKTTSMLIPMCRRGPSKTGTLPSTSLSEPLQ